MIENKIKLREWIERFMHYHRPWQDRLQIGGYIVAELYGPNGILKGRWRGTNIITNAGRAHIIDRLQGAGVAVCDYLALGSGTTAADPADTALETELYREQGSPDQPDAYTDRLAVVFGAGEATGTIGEAGRLNNSSGGTLMGRTVYTSWTPASTIPKGAGDSLTFTYSFTYAAS